jgi:hypothetical protein
MAASFSVSASAALSLRLVCFLVIATFISGICFCPSQQSLSPKGVAARDKLTELITGNVTSFPDKFPLRPLGWVDPNGWTAMHYAAAVGNIAAAKWLRAHYAPLVTPMDRRWSEEEQPRLENLCPKASALSGMQNVYAWQPLHVAAGPCKSLTIVMLCICTWVSAFNQVEFIKYVMALEDDRFNVRLAPVPRLCI